jgi:hypothetical protein
MGILRALANAVGWSSNGLERSTVIAAKLEHQNGQYPMFVALLPIMTVVRLAHSQNAPSCETGEDVACFCKRPRPGKETGGAGGEPARPSHRWKQIRCWLRSHGVEVDREDLEFLILFYRHNEQRPFAAISHSELPLNVNIGGFTSLR